MSIVLLNGKPVFWQCHTEKLLKEIIEANPTVSACARPLNIMAKILYVLADRAREINDPELNSLCCRLTLFAEADPCSPYYNKMAIDLIHKFDKKFLQRLNNPIT